MSPERIELDADIAHTDHGAPPVCPISVVDHGRSSMAAAVRRINENDGCPGRNMPISEPSDACPGDMEPDRMKQEYYGLLNILLPEAIGILNEFRERFPFGLVCYGDDGQLRPLVEDPKFQARAETLLREGEFLDASYFAHDMGARSIVIVTEEWARRLGSGNRVFNRMAQLLAEQRARLPFEGHKNAFQHIAAAMNQTTNISVSFQLFSDREFRANHDGVAPTSVQAAQMHENNLGTAIKQTELHLVRTEPYRRVLKERAIDGGVARVYTDVHGFFELGPDLQLRPRGTKMVDEMARHPIDTSDGRIGCPGKLHVPMIWGWLGELSRKFAFPVLDRTK